MTTNTTTIFFLCLHAKKFSKMYILHLEFMLGKGIWDVRMLGLTKIDVFLGNSPKGWRSFPIEQKSLWIFHIKNKKIGHEFSEKF